MVFSYDFLIHLFFVVKLPMSKEKGHSRKKDATTNEVKKARRLLGKGVTPGDVIKKTGVSRDTVYRLVRERRAQGKDVTTRRRGRPSKKPQ